MKSCKYLMICLSLFVISACSKLNLVNYEKLEMGMSLEEVEGIIGTASKCADAVGTKSCIWGREDGKHVKINFALGRAVMFSNQGLQ